MVAKAQRHRQIIKLIESGRISSQFDLAQQLSRVGIDTTQTTLSRDLTEIGVVKSAAGYQVLSAMLASGSETLPVDRISSLTATVRRLLLEVAIGGTQAVVHTPPVKLVLLLSKSIVQKCQGSLGPSQATTAYSSHAQPTAVRSRSLVDCNLSRKVLLVIHEPPDRNDDPPLIPERCP